MSRASDAIAIDGARAEDATAVRALLETHQLPTDDLESHLETAVVARRAGQVVGSAVPMSVQASVEIGSACPSTAIAMRKRL